MDKKLMINVIRYILTMVLLYGIFAETGIWTTGAFLLLVIMSEQITFALKKIREALEDIFGRDDV